MKNNNKNKKIIFGGAVAASVTAGLSIALPLIINNNNDNNDKNKDNSNLLIENHNNKWEKLTRENLISQDTLHLSDNNRHNYFSNDAELSNWIMDSIKNIDGLNNLNNDDTKNIEIRKNHEKGEVSIHLKNIDDFKPIILNKFKTTSHQILENLKIPNEIQNVLHYLKEDKTEESEYDKTLGEIFDIKLSGEKLIDFKEVDKKIQEVQKKIDELVEINKSISLENNETIAQIENNIQNNILNPIIKEKNFQLIFKPKPQEINVKNTSITIRFNEWDKKINTIDWGYKIGNKQITGTLEGWPEPEFSDTQIEEANQNISKINILLDLKANINKRNKSASEIKISDFKAPNVNNPDFLVEIIDLDFSESSKGKLITEVKISSNKIPEDLVPSIIQKIEIDGFITPKDIEKNARLAETNRINDAINNLAPTFRGDENNFLLKQDKLNELNKFIVIENIDDVDMNISSSISSNAKDTLELKIKLTSQKYLDISAQKVFSFSGFLTENDYNKAKRMNAEDSFNIYYDYLSKTNSSIFGLDKIKEKSLIDDISKNNFYILANDNTDTETSLIINGINKVSSKNTELEILWTLSSNNYANLEKNGSTIINGFQDPKIDFLNKLFQNINSSWINNELIKINDMKNVQQNSVKQYSKPEDINLEDSNINIKFTYWFQDTEKGKIDWKANVSYNNKNNNIIGNLGGFLKEKTDYQKIDDEKQKINQNLDQTLEWLKDVSDHFAKLSDQGVKGNDLIKKPNSDLFIPIDYGKNKWSFWGIPMIIRFAGWNNYIDDNFKKRENYKLIDYLQSINDNKWWKENAEKTLDPANSRGKVDSDLEFNVVYNSARMNPDDTTQLLLDIEFYSKKYPNLRRQYTVTYTGFKESVNNNITVQDKDNLLNLAKTELSNIFLHFPINIYKWGPYTSLLNFKPLTPEREKIDLFWSWLLDGKLNDKISWSYLDEFVQMLSDIDSLKSFNDLKDKISNITLEINNISNYQEFNNIEENVIPQFKLEMNKLVNDFFNEIQYLFSQEKLDLLKVSIKTFYIIMRYFTEINTNSNGDPEISFKFHEENPDETMLKETYWKDVLNKSNYSFSEVGPSILSGFIGNFIFKDTNKKLGNLYSEIRIGAKSDDKWFGHVLFISAIDPNLYFSEKRKLDAIVENIKSNKNNNFQNFVQLKNDISKDNYSVNMLNANNFILDESLQNTNFKYIISDINENLENDSIAEISISIESVINKNLKEIIVLEIPGFISQAEINSFQNNYNNDIGILNLVPRQDLESHIPTGNPSEYSFQQNKPNNFELNNEITAHFTAWEIFENYINYEITIFKGIAQRKINGQITGFKSLPNANSTADLNYDINEDLEITKAWLRLFHNIYEPSLDADNKLILLSLLKGNTEFQDLYELLSINNFDVYDLDLVLENDNKNGTLSFKIGTNSSINYKKEINIQFSNLKYTYEKMKNLIDSIEMKGYGYLNTAYARLDQPVIFLVKNTDENAKYYKNILKDNLVINGNLDYQNLMNYFRNIIQEKIAILPKNNEEYSYEKFLERIYQLYDDEKISINDLLQNTDLQTILTEFNNTELLTDIQNFVKNLISDNNLNINTSQILSEILLKVEKDANNYSLRIYYKDNERIQGPIFHFEESENPPITIDFNNIFKNNNESKKADWILTGRNKFFNYSWKSKKLIDKNIFNDSILYSHGYVTIINSIKLFNIFGDVVNVILDTSDKDNAMHTNRLRVWNDNLLNSSRTNVPNTSDAIDDIY